MTRLSEEVRAEYDAHNAEIGHGMTLVEFLEARIEDDEAAARHALSRGDGGALEYGGQWYGAIQHAERWEPARALAECAAKRAILEIYDTMYHDHDGTMYKVLRLLALPYADHPDHDEAWRP